MGGQMIFLKTDLCKDEEIAQAVADAAKLGAIKFVANIAGLQHIDPLTTFPWKKRLDERIMLRAPFLIPATIPHHAQEQEAWG